MSAAANVAGAGATGGGIGTVVAAFADGLPDSSPYKSLLTVASPLIAVGLSGLWLFLKHAYIDPVADRKRRAAEQKKYDAEMAQSERFLNKARAHLQSVRDDPNASDEHKLSLQKKVEELEHLTLAIITKRAENISPD